MTPKELCLLLDHDARRDLRQAIERKYINRDQRKKRGVQLLLDLSLIERTKTSKYMYRYEPTELGLKVAEFLPNRDAEWTHIVGQEPLVYADGTVVQYRDVPRYTSAKHYNETINSVYKARGLYGPQD